MKILLSAGEASGDMHGAALAKALQDRNPSIQLIGMGGKKMRTAGVDIYYPVEKLGFMGFVEVVKNLPKIWHLRKLVRQVLRREKPDVVVLIDYPGFNMRLASWAKALGIKTVFYISPSVWAWGKSRAKKIAATADLITALFSFEVDVYKKVGANVEFIGHPLLDIVECSISRAEARNRLDIAANKKVVLLLPGSRHQEIDRLLQPMLDTARLLAKNDSEFQFVLPLASTIEREKLLKQISSSVEQGRINLKVVENVGYDVFRAADIALAASGTVTLELALLGVPVIMVYRIASMSYFIGKLLISLKLFSLPNIVAGREIIPEYIQHEFSPPIVAKKLLEMLENDAQAKLQVDYQQMREKLGGGGAIARAADMIIDLAKSET